MQQAPRKTPLAEFVSAPGFFWLLLFCLGGNETQQPPLTAPQEGSGYLKPFYFCIIILIFSCLLTVVGA